MINPDIIYSIIVTYNGAQWIEKCQYLKEELHKLNKE